MSNATPGGILAISIDLELDGRHCGLQDQAGLDQVASRLLESLLRRGLAATWAVADPAVSAATDKLLAAPDQEIAILGDPAWVGASAGRNRFGRELERRVRQARASGISVTTLALRKVQLDAHLDLVVNNGVNVVRGPAPAVRRRNEFNQPQSLYSDLWLMPPSVALPRESLWWPGGGGFGAAARGLLSAARRQEVFHLAIDGLALAARGRAALVGLERTLRTASRLRDAGCLEALTVAGVARRFNERRRLAAAPQLRPAA